MSEREELAEVLIEHGDSGRVNSRENWIGCLCGAHLDCELDSSGYPLDVDAEDPIRANHAADAVLASPWLRAHDDRIREVAYVAGLNDHRAHDCCTGRVPEPLAQAIRDVCWKAQPYGEDDEGFVAYYLLSVGPIHRLIGAAQGVVPGAALRAAAGTPTHDTTEED